MVVPQWLGGSNLYQGTYRDFLKPYCQEQFARKVDTQVTSLGIQVNLNHDPHHDPDG